MSQPFPAVLGGRWSALEGGYQSNDSNGLRLPSPTAYGNLAAWYDVSDYSSLVVDGSNRVSLIADKSGNSATNCLCLNGASGNYASAPDSAALDITGDITLIAKVAFDSIAPGSSLTIISKSIAGQLSYRLDITSTSKLNALISLNGTTFGVNLDSTANVPFVAYQKGWVAMTRQSSSGTIKIYTASDTGSNTAPSFPGSWTQLGTSLAGTSGAISAGTALLNIGAHSNGSAPLAGRIYRSTVINGYDGAGSVVFDSDFTAPSKLATSFTESSSNAATVTINSSGDLGARISGERDLVQLTASKQPIYTAAAAGVGAYITFDGSDDYMKAAAFSLSQPDTIYLVGRQVSWTNNDRAYDGNAADTMTLNQTTASGGVSPQVGIYANSQTGLLSTWTLGLDAVMTAVFNGASSGLRLNRNSASSGNAGNASGNGFTLGSGGSGAGTNGNFRSNEVVIYSAAHDTSVQDRVIQYAGRKWGISGV